MILGILETQTIMAETRSIMAETRPIMAETWLLTFYRRNRTCFGRFLEEIGHFRRTMKNFNQFLYEYIKLLKYQFYRTIVLRIFHSIFHTCLRFPVNWIFNTSSTFQHCVFVFFIVQDVIIIWNLPIAYF